MPEDDFNTDRSIKSAVRADKRSEVAAFALQDVPTTVVSRITPGSTAPSSVIVSMFEAEHGDRCLG